MKRSGFSRKVYEPAPKAPLRPLARPVVYAKPSVVAKVCPKDAPLRDEAYRRLVSSLPCAHCGRYAPSQVAHADSAGKGMGIKASDLYVMPLCAPREGSGGCHWLISTSGKFSKDDRRELERKYVEQTREKLREFK